MDDIFMYIDDEEFTVKSLQWGVGQNFKNGKTGGTPLPLMAAVRVNNIKEPLLRIWGETAKQEKKVKFVYVDGGTPVRHILIDKAECVRFLQRFTAADGQEAAELSDEIHFVYPDSPVERQGQGEGGGPGDNEAA